ncbi:MAG: hypothetical protein MSA90_17955 [Faecalicatena sp.]|uniref:hypothetical protein n=1 Tax=Faecalicatena sp. TaxID=2005360 RepID=UPI002589E446|nr:hypothetical protein [Faecalicatena sp.]MCI6467334.1 hypothetical protein [Faecalicatena sp.]MDY5620340.1 hypothetical protein [Lachnospiraceae bacterium]
MDKKIGFDDFIAAVPVENQEFVKELHDKLMDLGCKIEIKTAKSGYMVSYIYNKKTVANYVFRKKGMLVRIYGVHVNEYEKILETLPDEMISAIQKAPICKRLADPNDCNPRCSMGYDFWLKGEHYQKCRNSAFLFLVCPQNNPSIQSLLLNEVNEWKKSIV